MWTLLEIKKNTNLPKPQETFYKQCVIWLEREYSVYKHDSNNVKTA